MSKGTLQKVNIIQSLLKNADIYIFDEPFNGLDTKSCTNFINILKKLKTHKTIIFTSHEYEIAQELASHILDLDNKLYNTKSTYQHFTFKYITIPYTNKLSKECLNYVNNRQRKNDQIQLRVEEQYCNILLQHLIQNNHTILEVKEE